MHILSNAACPAFGCLNCKSIASLFANQKAGRHSTEPTAIADHATLRGPSPISISSSYCLLLLSVILPSWLRSGLQREIRCHDSRAIS